MTKTYLISNATVKEARAEFRERTDELQWTITPRTIIQELNETHDNVLETSYNFTPFTQLQAHMDKISDISIIPLPFGYNLFVIITSYITYLNRIHFFF